MPVLSETNKAAFIRLKNDYEDLPLSSKSLLPHALVTQLNEMDTVNLSTESAFEVYQAYISHTWTSSSLKDFFNEPLTQALTTLSKAGLLAGDGAQANFDAVVGHQNPNGVSRALTTLSEAGLLAGDGAQANRDAVTGNQNPRKAALALKTLSEAGLLAGDGAQANRDAVAGHQNPGGVARALKILSEADLLAGDGAQANRDAVAGNPNPCEVARALKILSEAGLLAGDGAQANRDALMPLNNIGYINLAFNALRTAGLLAGDGAQANFTAVVGHQYPHGVASSIVTLDAVAFLTEANFNAVIGHQDVRAVAEALKILMDARLIGAGIEQSQERFNRLTTYQAILFDGTTRALWGRIPSHALTEARWNRIMQICRANMVNTAIGRQRFTNYVHRELLEMEVHQQQAFNTGQSTHTASVHQTVSETARKLKARYGDSVRNLSEKLKTIEAWVNEQEEHETEKRAIQQLVNSSYDFKDLTSGVTTKELLALAWEAIHDKAILIAQVPGYEKMPEAVRKARENELVNDAEQLFLQGLLEIQRAYNLSDRFEDRGGADKAACASGTFNKLIEKLAGVHPDAEIKYITRQGAMFKLLPLIRDAAAHHVQAHHQDMTVEQLKQAILPRVREQLFFEFGHAFEASTKAYDTFDLFQASGDYETFQNALKNRQDEHLEQMIESKLLMPNEELDQAMSDLITRHAEAKPASEEPEDKPETQEALRFKRLKFLLANARESDTSADKPSSNKPQGTGPTHGNNP
ncbi:MAG: hypothetical protein P1U39_04855 [Legionellaceae bacterium]|nr:hypothetical protein [Legionellaceae bacterium]